MPPRFHACVGIAVCALLACAPEESHLGPPNGTATANITGVSFAGDVSFERVQKFPSTLPLDGSLEHAYSASSHLTVRFFIPGVCGAGSDPAVKASPRCAEEERVEAPVCRSCGTDLRATGYAAPPRSFAVPLSAGSYLGRILLGETSWPTAPFVRRIVAAGIDALIVAIVGIPGGFMAVHGWFSEPARALGLVAAGSALTLAALAYALTKDGWRGGAGIGKRLLGLRVVDVERGAPCTLMRAALRGSAMVALASVPYGGWAIEPGVAIIAAGGRRLGDHLAGTQVVATAAQPSV